MADVFDPVSRTDSLPSVGRMSSTSRLDDSRDLTTTRRRLDVDSKVKLDGVTVFNSVIGKGSFAAVHEGKIKEKDVIVKRVHESLLSSPSDRVDELVKSLERHWSILGNLDHPQIVPYLGVCVLDDFTPGIVREKYEVSLRQRVGLEPRLDLRQRIDIASDVAEALHYLHDRGVIHGRLTTSHVLLGEGSGAKVCDVGLVKVYAEVFGSTVRTHFVTPYTSPERSQSPETVSKEDDCFAYGLVLLSDEVCREPPSLLTTPRVSTANDSSLSPELKRHDSDLAQVEDSNPLREIIISCLQDKPSARPTAAKLLEKVNKLKDSSEYPHDGRCDDDHDGGRAKGPTSGEDTRSFWSLPGEVAAHGDRSGDAGEESSRRSENKYRGAHAYNKSSPSLKAVDPSRRQASTSSGMGLEGDRDSSQKAVILLGEVATHLDSLRRSVLIVARDMGDVLLEAQGAHREARSARQIATAAREEASESRREAGAACEAALAARTEAKGGRQEAASAREASQRLCTFLGQKPDIGFGDELEPLSFVADHQSFSFSSAMEDEPAPGEMTQSQPEGVLPPIPEDMSSSLPRSVQKRNPSEKWEDDLRRRIHNIGKVSAFLSHVRRFDFAMRCLLSTNSDWRDDDSSRTDDSNDDVSRLRHVASKVLAQAEREPWLAFPFGEWSPKSQLPHATGGAPYACVHENAVYVASRQMTMQGRQSFLCRSQDLEDWEDITLPPATAACHALFSFGQHLFLVTRPEEGDETSQKDIVWRRDGDGWLQFAKLRNVQWHYGLAVHQHTAIFAGGWDGRSELDLVEVLDLNTGEWLEPLTPMLTKAFAMQALVHNEQLVLVGATTRKADLSEIYMLGLNPNTPHYNRWRVQSCPISACGACSVHRHVVLVGGWDMVARRASPLMSCLDPEHSEWLTLPLLKNPRVRPALVYFRQKLLCVGGSTTPSRDAERVNILEVMRLEVSA